MSTVWNEMSQAQMSTYCVIPFISTKIGNGSLCHSNPNSGYFWEKVMT